jgi:hypothetical protein
MAQALGNQGRQKTVSKCLLKRKALSGPAGHQTAGGSQKGSQYYNTKIGGNGGKRKKKKQDQCC